MYALPAEVPAADAPRADVVEVRVARKVAALFGLSSDVDPFRRSWVCDFTALSLAEISRGAPNPGRGGRFGPDAAPPQRAADGEAASWTWSGRAVWSPSTGYLPGALSNATMNRYGPNTKAGAVLSAANRLLRGSTAAVSAACRHLAETGCDPDVRLAVWAGLVLEVYRAQPALVVAAVQARQVQRSLSARWGAQVDRAGVTKLDAPCEVHPGATSDADRDAVESRWRPTSFDLIDSTLPTLGLADDTPAGPGVVTADALDDIATAWCHRLLAVGRPGRGVVWLTEDGGGSRRAHAMVRVGAVVAPFVAASLGSAATGQRDSPVALPVLPPVDVLSGVALPQRRAHLLVAHVAASYVRYRDELLLGWPQLRSQTRDLVEEAVHGCTRVLDADDPVTLQLEAYAAYLTIWDRPRSPAKATVADLNGQPPTARLVASQQRVMAAWRSGRLDPGAAAYLLEIGIAALHDAAAHHHEGTGPPAPADEHPTRAAVQGWWSAILEARGLNPDTDLSAGIDSLSNAQVFHLHHYAAWLARSRRRSDLRRALAVQVRVAAVRAEVIRREPATFAAKSAAARAGHELAAEIATDLALATPERERGARARALQTAVRHAHFVLADPSTRDLLRRAGPQPTTVRAAWVVGRALCLAAAERLTVAADDIAAAVALIDSAIGGGGGTAIGGGGGTAIGGGGGTAGNGGSGPGGWAPGKAARAQLRAWRDELAPVPADAPSRARQPGPGG